MIKGLKFISELGSGTSSIADLYEDNHGKRFVLKTSVLGFDEVTINKHNQYELVYRFSFNGLNTARTHEFAFYNLVSKIPNSESQYFVKMYRYNIGKYESSYPFNADRLKSSGTKDMILRTDVNNRIYIRQLIDYGGISLEQIIGSGNLTQSDIDKVGKALLKIIKITRKYKWLAGDIHPGNICISNGQVKLIDYGGNYPMTNPNVYAIKMRYEIRAEALDVLSVIAGFDISRIAANMRLPEYSVYFADLAKMKVYPKIRRLMIDIFGKSSHKNYVTAMMSDIDKGIIIDEYNSYSYYMSVLWNTIDKKSFDEYVKTHFPEYKPIELRAKQSTIHEVLQYVIGKS